MGRVLKRIVFSFLIAVTVVLIAAVAIAKLVSLMRGPHEAAADLESAIGGYWPLIVLAIVALTIGLSVVGRRDSAPER
jgi:predicted CDP-diglyceride synthetase/phosphatidate cytidylyltransferase